MAFPHAFQLVLWFHFRYFPLRLLLPLHFSTIMLTETFIKVKLNVRSFFIPRYFRSSLHNKSHLWKKKKNSLMDGIISSIPLMSSIMLSHVL